MPRLELMDLLIIGILAFVIFVPADLRTPPRPPRHPVPGQEPYLTHLLLRIKRHRADSWHF